MSHLDWNVLTHEQVHALHNEVIQENGTDVLVAFGDGDPVDKRTLIVVSVFKGDERRWDIDRLGNIERKPR